jgi:tungstate transport system substrate-binding protein
MAAIGKKQAVFGGPGRPAAKSAPLYLSVALTAVILALLTGPTGNGTWAYLHGGEVTGGVAGKHQAGRLRVATTTSLYDTGLWGALEPLFEKRYGIDLDVLYAGTGIALEYGRRGDVDAIAVHSRDREERFVSEGYGIKRVPFAYNYFLIVGPAGDPAGIRGKTPEEAFRTLIEAKKSPFVSRGDDSGTHSREKSIWRLAGYGDYEAVRDSGDWYIESGQGMGPTLLIANEKGAYTLSDIGTFLAYRGKMDLVPTVEKGPGLINVYSVIACNPEKNPGVHYESALKLVEFLTSPEIQALIGDYGTDRYGISLFTPCAGADPQGEPQIPVSGRQ